MIMEKFEYSNDKMTEYLHKGYGYVCFMGGCQGEPTIYSGGEEMIIFTKEDIESNHPEYLRMLELQKKDCEEYMRDRE